jgi:hypothetical protein
MIMRRKLSRCLSLLALATGAFAAAQPGATPAKPTEAETMKLQAAFTAAAGADSVKAAEARIKELQTQAQGAPKGDQAGLRMSAKSAQADLLTAYRNAMLKADPDLPSAFLDAFIQGARKAETEPPAKPRTKPKK